MPIVCLAFVGKTNEPMYVHTADSDDADSLQLHSIGKGASCSLFSQLFLFF